MEMQARRIFRQPERAFVAEEMHLMSAPRQFLAQAGGENAAAAHRRITGDADFHAFVNHRWTRIIRTGELSFTRHLTPASPPTSLAERDEKSVTFLVFNPFIGVHPWFKLKSPRAPAHLRQRVEHERIIWKQGDGVADPRAQPAQTRPRELQFNVIAGGNLRNVRFHRGGPSLKNVRRGHINQHRSDVGRFGFGRHRVIKQLLNRMRRRRGAIP